jgi:hypothetical protein
MIMRRKKTHEEYCAELIEKGINARPIDKYNGKVKIRFECECGDPYDAWPNDVLNGHLCKKCGREKASKNNTKTHDEYCMELLKMGIIVKPIDLYLGMNEKIIHRCECGKPYNVRPSDVINGHLCKECGIKNRRKSEEFAHKQYLSKLIKKKINVYPLETYKGSNIPILQQCICLESWTVTPSDVLSGHLCQKCAKRSIGNDKIENILFKKCVKYIREYKFKDCKNILPLPFDFYLPEENVCIEFDGHYHYYKGEIKKYTNLKNSRFSDEDIDKVKFRDSIKTQYCINNNIKLIRIPFWEFKNIEEILMRELNL